MTPLATAAVLGGLLGIATAIGLVWRWQDGRVRHAADGAVVLRRDLPGSLGETATLLQFSSEVCAPCVATRAVLRAVAGERADVAHIDLDVAASGALVARFNILQTPTTLILDGNGVVRARIGGAARRDTVTAELERLGEPVAA